MNSDFPYSQKKQRSRKSYMIKSIIESLPECVEEEKPEDEEVSNKNNFYYKFSDGIVSSLK